MIMRFVLVILIGIFLFGCGEGNQNTRPYVMGQNPNGPYKSAIAAQNEKIETARIEAGSQEKIAQINKERDIEVQKLKSDTEVTKATINKDVAIEEVAAKKIAMEQEHEYSTALLYVLAVALVLLFIFLFYYTGKNRRERLKKHEDEIMLKLRTQEQEMKMKMAEKMLDSITSGKLTPEQENRLIESLEHATNRLIEHKK